jgi:enamine deaminase RidA (YjgF/YER057c/UK114 family)
MPKEHLNPAGLPHWSESFSQVVIVRTGAIRSVHISGQVSVDANNAVVGPGDLRAQAERAFANLGRRWAAGATPEDVVRLGIYVVNYEPKQAGVIGEAMRRLFVGESCPRAPGSACRARAADLLIEVEARRSSSRSAREDALQLNAVPHGWTIACSSIWSTVKSSPSGSCAARPEMLVLEGAEVALPARERLLHERVQPGTMIAGSRISSRPSIGRPSTSKTHRR